MSGRAESWLRSACVRALEALEDGSPDEAAAFLRSALYGTRRRRFVCPDCRQGFAWPGLLDNHQRMSACALRRVAG